MAVGYCETTGKKRYASRKTARFTARETRAGDGRGRLSTYVCEDCGSWHVGRLPAPVVRGVKAREDIVHWRAS